MKKTLANALRALARRIDPPAPIAIRVYDNAVTANNVMGQISWGARGDL